ncbi:MAG TPA: YggS family pyridoxal phosphate-dependent enzyme [Candidatus Binataceae bacterium]|nr:YggS family pyridoxal phosphate-dependent enzyme [Candidatus Binataceae bacterium]
MLSPEEIADRLHAVRERICSAASRAGRPAEAVRLVLASKTQLPATLAAAFAVGARDFGENYVQEAVAKRAALAGYDVRWHLIGHLQSNKAHIAAQTFDCIQTLDNQRLASALSRHRSTKMPVLIEINIGDESTKDGIAPESAESLINAIRRDVEVRGLMTIPPAVANPEAARPYFCRLRELRDRLASTTGLALSELSMGMTDDFEAAIAEGATIVRVGRAVFGERTT